MIAKRSFYNVAAIVVGALLIGSCAGRDARPVAVSQPQDASMACAQIQSEILANNKTISELGSEKGAKVAQNIAAGVVGILVWPVWFAMDFKGAASTDQAALESRNQYLASIANSERCASRPTFTTPVVAQQPAVVLPQPATMAATPVVVQQAAGEPQRPATFAPQQSFTVHQPAAVRATTAPSVAPYPTPSVAPYQAPASAYQQPTAVVEQSRVTMTGSELPRALGAKPPPIVVFTYASDATHAEQSSDFDLLINSVANGAKPAVGGN